ncbi:hypothetical protein MN116_006448 [Schistosoma mekongi]|uniref:Cadherin domain-containing protein n=1 Tax=Schistosoma mekongi TaxID=38744 RepID=A0AAE1ZBV3_SCHME|nr:hypothetical protein MN116_006448 [Schistosoma mekongi]
MELWRQNAKNYILFHFLLINYYLLVYHFINVIGLCFKQTGSIAISYQITEESIIPMIIGNLKKDLCIDQYSIEEFDNFNKQHEFILFPTSQPFYEYFNIKNEILSNHNEQYLILRKTIDREILCSIINTKTNLLKSTLNQQFYTDTYIHQQHTNDDDDDNNNNNRLCNCHDLLGWCSIHLHLALIPYHNNNVSYDQQQSLTTTLSYIDTVKQMSTIQSTDYLLNYINRMQFFIIELQIIDINDNIPIFNPSNYKIIISESDKPGLLFRLPSAIDNDLGSNSMLTYEIITINAINQYNITQQLYSINNHNSNYSQQFLLIHEINPQSSITSQSINYLEINKLYLKLIKPLDREIYHFYNINIIAIDKGIVKQNTGTLNLLIHVGDINDEYPIFDKIHYVFHITENLLPGSIIGKVHANDIDIGNNSLIKYTIKEIKSFFIINNQYNIDLFYIDSITGEIKLNTLIDREIFSQIILIIEAKDNGQPSKSSLTSVTIIIHDINDNNPIINLWGYKGILNTTGLTTTTTTNNNNNNNNNNVIPLHLLSSYNSLIPIHLWISEYLLPRSIIAILKVNDIDEGVNGTVECILNHSYFQLQLEIIPINNNNNNKDTNNSKSYYLLSLESLDYELQTMHYLTILCYDLGLPLAKTSTIHLNIHIHDENDNEPKFLQPEIYSPIKWLNQQKFQLNTHNINNNNNNISNILNFHKLLLKHQLLPLDISIPETCSINTIIMKFPILDIDSGINSLINYKLYLINQYVLHDHSNNNTNNVHITNDNNDNFIEINNTTGEITICKSLKLIPDYIKFLYEIHVNDCGIPKHTIRLYITIQITIVNLYPPNIQLFYMNPINTTLYEIHKSSINKKYEMVIYENQPINTIIGKIIGLDKDRGEAGRVTFKIIQNLIKTCIGSYKKVNDLILINSVNGIITITKSIDREIDGNLILMTLLVQDHGIPLYTTTVNIDIKILDINDNPPRFLLPIRSCRQSDINNNNNNNNNQSDNINDKLTCNTINMYSLEHYSNQIFNLTMLLPKKLHNHYLYPFAQFKAIDYDIDMNALITYHLNENCSHSNKMNKYSFNQLFVIDEYSGCLSCIIHQLHNDNIQSTYTFCIIAKDHGEFIQYHSIIEANVNIQLQINQTIIFMNYSIKSIEQLIKTKMSLGHYYNEKIQQLEQQQQQQEQQKQQEQQHQHTLTPVIRTLLCITTTIGGLMIIIVGILSIKQPKWLLRNLCKRNSNEAAKVELLRFHEVHNQIEVKRNVKHKSNEMKIYDIELERNQNYPLLLCSNTDTSPTNAIVTQTHSEPVQIHLPQDYCIEHNNSTNCSDGLLTYCSHSQCQQSQHRSNHNLHSIDLPPVFLHIIRTCDMLDDTKLIKPIIETTTTTEHIVDSKEMKCIYCNEKTLDTNWNQNIV